MGTVSSDEERYAPVDGVIWNRLGDDVALLDTRAGVYFGIEGAGSTVWERLQAGPASFGELAAAVEDAFEVEPQRCRADLRVLLDDLLTQGLVRKLGADDAPA